MTTKTQSNGEPNDEHSKQDKSGTHLPLSRRATLGLFGLGGLGLLAEPSTAQPSHSRRDKNLPFYNWREGVAANGHILSELGALSMADNPTAITDFVGENLSIDANGVMNATGTHTAVSDDGSEVLGSTDDVNFGMNLMVTDDGDGSVTVDASDVFTWEDTDDGNTDIRRIQSRSGHALTFDDADIGGGITIETAGGQVIELSDESGSESVSIADMNGQNSLRFDPSNRKVSLTGGGTLAIEAENIELKANRNALIESSGTLTLKGSLVNIN